MAAPTIAGSLNSNRGNTLTQDLDFSFNGLPVGYFEEPSYPRTPGRYRYMPYRGLAHYDLVQALASGSAQCSFSDGDSVYAFVVRSVPEYGVLQIDAIRRS